ncbi:hypothetical protein V2J56_03520 [Georgenia sp. MJ206]|uniref:hypothetical protein n=1 Tax=Georgenia wangjunii TaxID=3117730 RepID=UPI002F267BA2
MKFSLHGPDPRGHKPGRKLALVEGRPKSGLVAGDDVDKPKWYDGEPVADGVRRVLRVRVPWYMLDGSVPDGVGAKNLKGNFLGHLVQPPPYMRAVDIDFYVSEGDPYWPFPEDVREQNAAMGPLRNQSGQILTAVVDA